MAKAINWPLQFRDEVLGEDTEALHCALRPGRLYFDNQYWVPGEVVDIRVNHLKVRKGKIEGELKLCLIRELSDSDLSAYRMKSKPDVIAFLTGNYNQSVDENTEVTVVYYKNLPVVAEEVET